MRRIAISDIHGCLEEFEELLEKVRYLPGEDHLLLLGDFVDRGPDSKGVLKRVRELANTPHVTALFGNHDEMFLDWLYRGDFQNDPYLNEFMGGTKTIRSFAPFYEPGVNEQRARRHIRTAHQADVEFLFSLPNYYEDEEFIFVHAGIDPSLADWRTADEDVFRWVRREFVHTKLSVGKTVVFGHTTTTFLREEPGNHEVWFQPDKIGIDGACAFGGQLNALIITDGRYETVSVPQKG